jgi:exopolysaccharide biosynthesis polyprenyl glycosylphosphotransferase
MAIENTSVVATPMTQRAVTAVAAAPELRRRSHGAASRRGRSLARACRQRKGRCHVISEDLFRGVLVRERKRADRSNQPFVLLLLSAKDASPSLWAAAVEAATAVKRETDVVGWFKNGSVLGVILPEIAIPEVLASELEGRARQELSRRVDLVSASTFSVRAHAHTPGASAGHRTGFQFVEPLLATNSPRKRQLDSYDVAKRALDVVGSLALLILLSPLVLLISALVKLTSAGPILFKQTRVGLDARPFTMLKFRTMRVNVDPGVHQQYVSWFINSSGQTGDSEKNGLFKIANDPRVTAVGRILRKTSFDELPQLLNVLRGEMSLVGPRPPLHYEVEEYKPWHRRRVLEAKPGITGLWQVTGRSRTTFDEMVRLDLRYARTRSLWTDIKILLATPAAVISGKGAC